jgi:hypothetical protein
LIDALEDEFDIDRGTLTDVITDKDRLIDRVSDLFNDKELKQLGERVNIQGDRTEILTMIDRLVSTRYE